METVGSGLDHRVDQRSRAAAEFGRVCIRLDLELFERFHRGLDYLHVEAAEAIRVRSIVDSVQLECILERAIAVHIEDAAKADGGQPRCRRQHARR